MCPTNRQQEFIESVESACKGLKNGVLSPGVCGSCAECQEDYNFKPDTELDFWQERDRLFIGLRVVGTDHHVCEFWDEEAWQFIEDWGLESAFILGKLHNPQKLLSALRSYAEECDIDIPQEVVSESMCEAVSQGKISEEGGFSWSSCDCCNSSLGGNRYAAHGLDQDGSVIHFEVCEDCLLYLANGDIPERPYE